jgi:Holliday junction DNA helicase RuvB
MFFHLDFYEPTDLVEIIKRSSSVLGIRIDDEGALEVAKRSRGTPRVANRLLRRVRDWTDVKADGTITKEITEKALNNQGIDTMGLDIIDRKVIKSIMDFYKGGPVGIESLAATLNEEVDTIVDVVEPFLLKIGFLKRTPRGRELTDIAYGHMGHSVKRQKELL